MAKMDLTERPLTAQRLAMCKEWGYEAKLAEWPIARLSTDALQSRHGTRKAEVIDQYMEAKRGGALFPLPGVTDDGVVIWGKASTEADIQLAAMRQGMDKIPAITLINTNWADSSQAVQDDLHLLDIMTNVQNGERPSDDDLREGIRSGLRRELTRRRIAAILAIPLRKVNEEAERLAARDRLEKLVDAEVVERLTGTQMRALGRVSPKLNDSPFKKLALLTTEASLRNTEIDQIAASAQEAKSDATANKIIAAQQTALASRIRRVRVTGEYHHHERTALEMLLPTLAAIAKYQGKEEEVLHREPVGNPEFREQWIARLAAVHETTGKLLQILANAS